jgi:hypothetical protein
LLESRLELLSKTDKGEKYLVQLTDEVNKERYSDVWYHGEEGMVYMVTKENSEMFKVIGLKGPYGPHKDSGPLYISKSVCTVIKKLEGEEETMESELRIVEPFTPYDVIQKHKEVFGWEKLQDACDEFLDDLDLMIEVAEGNIYGTIESKEDLDFLELEDRDEMRKYFLKWGFIEEVEDPKHDWSGLQIKGLPGSTNILTLYDSNSDKYLLGFEPNGKVIVYPDAEGEAGFFDDGGRLIIK